MEKKLRIIFKKLRKDLGYYVVGKGVIEIESRSNQLQKIETLFHEFTHAVCDILVNRVFISDDEPEKIVSAVKTQNDEEKLAETISKFVGKQFKKYLGNLR